MRSSDWSSDVCSSDLLVRKGEPAAPAELARHECLRTSASKDGAVWELWAGSKVEKVTVKGRMAMNNVVMIMRMAELGMGIVPLAINSLSQHPDGQLLQRVLPDWEFGPFRSEERRAGKEGVSQCISRR